MTQDPPESPPTRREYLHATGLAGLALLSGCSSRDDPETPTTTGTTSTTAGTPTSTREPAETETGTSAGYDRVVDVVEAGADPEGNQSVTPVLEKVVDDDTLLSFPPGTYFFGSPWRFEGYSNLGLVGDRATFIPAEDLAYWLLAFDVADFGLAGITLDHRGQDVGPQVQVHATGGQNVVRDLTVRGFHDSDQIPLIPNVEAADASLLVERLRVPDGTESKSAVYVGPDSVGELTFTDCYLEGCAQGIYASAHSGPFHALGGTYLNNNKAAIRVGAGSHGAHIHGVHVRIDDPDPEQWTLPTNLRGLWLREGMDTSVTGCDIELLDLAGAVSDGAIFVDDLMGPATIRDTRIRVDDDAYAIRAQPASGNAGSLQGDQGLPDDHHLTCENVRVTGSADRLDAIRIIGRDGSTFRNVVVDQPNGVRRGLVLVANATDTVVQGGSLVTGHHPIVVEADRRTLTGGSCPVRLEDITRLEATNVEDAGSQLAFGTSGEYCVDGVGNVEDATEIVVAVAGVRDGALVGERLSAESYQQTRFG